MDPEVEIIVDARGHRCPVPTLRLRRAVARAEAGAILRLIADGDVVRSWISEDYWLDIGRHDDYEQAQEEFESVRDRLIPEG